MHLCHLPAATIPLGGGSFSIRCSGLFGTRVCGWLESNRRHNNLSRGSDGFYYYLSLLQLDLSTSRGFVG
jgi:hypothetical protein